jgi:hypothetical protein
LTCAALGVRVALQFRSLSNLNALTLDCPFAAAAAAAVLVSMAGGLQSLGVIDLFSGWAGGQLSGLALPWPALFAVLHLLFFSMHYLFASQTAHVGALFAAFCSLMISAGACVLTRQEWRTRLHCIAFLLSSVDMVLLLRPVSLACHCTAVNTARTADLHTSD